MAAIDKSKYYVNNKEFFQLLVDFNTETDPIKHRIIYNKIGKIFLLIATNFMNHPKHIGRTEDRKQEMISQATYTCCKYIKSFKVDKNSSPLSYFTSVCKNSFMLITQKYNLQRERYTSLDMLEAGEGYNLMANADNSNLIQTQVRKK